MKDYCKNCGAPIRGKGKFCHECGRPIEQNSCCENCGAEISPNEKYCQKCGHKHKSAISSIPQTDSKNKTIIFILIAVVAVLAVAVILASGVLTPDVPLVTEDFGVFTMLIPEGSNFVETSSIPSYGFGGYVGMENAGDYSDEVFSIMVSTIRGGTHPSEVSLDRQEGDITVYKSNQGKTVYYIERDIGEYEFTVIGNDDETIIRMLNSVIIAD